MKCFCCGKQQDPVAGWFNHRVPGMLFCSWECAELQRPPPYTPPLIRQLASEANTLKPGVSPSSNRAVIADWCESESLFGYAMYLRPRPIGVDEHYWTACRATIMRWLAGDGVPSMLAPADHT
jgi:hypothetical protein